MLPLSSSKITQLMEPQKDTAAQRVAQASQCLHSVLPPKCAASDIRHNPDEEVLLYDVGIDDHLLRCGVGYTPGCERTGVSHLVHAWHAQGHPHVSKAFCTSRAIS